MEPNFPTKNQYLPIEEEEEEVVEVVEVVEEEKEKEEETEEKEKEEETEEKEEETEEKELIPDLGKQGQPESLTQNAVPLHAQS